MLNTAICQKARLSRDPRFDGKFFTAVKTTGIYCRTICPVSPPKEQNVVYYSTAVECATEGFRPCLRCRPDSAPNSPAWKGVNATLNRAIRLIDEGALQHQSLVQLSDRLGITDRYLRKLFDVHLGISPKRYALYQQCLFAKNLLHQTSLPITQIALASGFSSVRRFNSCFKEQLQLTPTAVRKSTCDSLPNSIVLKLYYRPPFNWAHMQGLLKARAVEKIEWCTEQGYGRTFDWLGSSGQFTATHVAKNNMFNVEIELNDMKQLKSIVNNIRRILDLDVDMLMVEHDIQQCFVPSFNINPGIRLPGIWSIFEAGVRAVLGQQISVAAARNLVAKLVEHLGQPLGGRNDSQCIFPTAKSIVASDLSFLKIPNSRKQTLHNLAHHFVSNDASDNPQSWLKLKGIGPWTLEYAQLRGQSDPDVFLAGDLGVKNALKKLSSHLTPNFSPEQVSPWRSYLTFQLWSKL
jgi:AraC family transcriptional regulator of adaptative response / DNA-3-methyladenine glycosylase II